jgi:hypothetical protein
MNDLARLALPVAIEKAKRLIFRERRPGIPITLEVWNIPSLPPPSRPCLMSCLCMWPASTGRNTVSARVADTTIVHWPPSRERPVLGSSWRSSRRSIRSPMTSQWI